VDDQKTDGGNVYKQILINAKFKKWKERSKDRADLEKSIKEVRVRIGL
jgi:hypothetical protein